MLSTETFPCRFSLSFTRWINGDIKITCQTWFSFLIYLYPRLAKTDKQIRGEFGAGPSLRINQENGEKAAGHILNSILLSHHSFYLRNSSAGLLKVSGEHMACPNNIVAPLGHKAVSPLSTTPLPLHSRRHERNESCKMNASHTLVLGLLPKGILANISSNKNSWYS